MRLHWLGRARAGGRGARGYVVEKDGRVSFRGPGIFAWDAERKQ